MIISIKILISIIFENFTFTTNLDLDCDIEYVKLTTDHREIKFFLHAHKSGTLGSKVGERNKMAKME